MSEKFFLLFFVVLLSACSSPPVSVDPKASFAMNVVKAAGMSNCLEDKLMPKDTVSSFTDSMGFGLAYAASGYNTSLPGFNPTEIVGLNFAAWLLGPKPPAARNSLIAWMPEELAEGDAENRLADILLEGASQGAAALGYTAKKAIARGGTDKSGVAVYLLGPEGSLCEENKHGYSGCWVNFGIRNAKLGDQTPEVVGFKGGSWFFDPAVSSYSRFGFPKINTGLNELDVLVAVSRFLPKWIYFYVAPRKISLGHEKPVKAPLIIHQGRIQYFIAIE